MILAKYPGKKKQYEVIEVKNGDLSVVSSTNNNCSYVVNRTSTLSPSSGDHASSLQPILPLPSNTSNNAVVSSSSNPPPPTIPKKLFFCVNP